MLCALSCELNQTFTKFYLRLVMQLRAWTEWKNNKHKIENMIQIAHRPFAKVGGKENWINLCSIVFLLSYFLNSFWFLCDLNVCVCVFVGDGHLIWCIYDSHIWYSKSYKHLLCLFLCLVFVKNGFCFLFFLFNDLSLSLNFTVSVLILK